MNYQAIYSKIIDNRKSNPITEGYSEVHHILPRSLGGTDDPDNLVRLTAREHFIVHYLLAKMYPQETPEWYKMIHAFSMMKCKSGLKQSRYFNSRLYEFFRLDFSYLRSIWNKNTIWIHNPLTRENKKHPKNNPIPKGWIRTFLTPQHYEKRLQKTKNIKISKKSYKQKMKHIRENSEYQEKIRRICRERQHISIDQLREWYQAYKELGWSAFREKYSYTRSQPNFVMRCRRYLPEFESSQGKARGSNSIEVQKQKAAAFKKNPSE